MGKKPVKNQTKKMVSFKTSNSTTLRVGEISFYMKLPDWLWLPKGVDRFEVGIAASAIGICMFVSTHFHSC
jgi:hypothetical protein